MISQKYVNDYLDGFKNGRYKFNKRRQKMIKIVEDEILTDDTLYFDDKKIEDCIAFANKWFFEFNQWECFLTSLIFLYHKKNNRRVIRKFIIVVARGAGKNGFVSAVSAFLLSSLHGVHNYHGSIIANSEEQAMTSVTEIKDVIDSHEQLKNEFYATNSKIQSKSTNSALKYRTSNGSTKDGLRDGFVIFDEIHQYPDNRNVKVHISGLGKVKDSRVFEIGSKGYVREGYFDKEMEKVDLVLDGKASYSALFPFICELDDLTEMNDPENWELANPSFAMPMNEYSKDVYQENLDDFHDLEIDPSGYDEFVIKRMNYELEDVETSVAPYEQVKETNQEIPYDKLEGRESMGSVDFASMRDFCAAGLMFKMSGKYYHIQHQWARKQFVDKYYGFSRAPENRPSNAAPIPKWNKDGLITIVDTPTIDPQIIVEWFVEMRDKYLIDTIWIDNFRADLLRRFFEEADFEVEVIRNPTAADGLLAPRIEDGFANQKFVWGDNPLLRWNTQNVLVTVDRAGNKKYGKKEERRRKTDGFKAFEYGLWRADDLPDTDIGAELGLLTSIDF